MYRLCATAESRTGRRERNEDAYELDSGLGLFVVADGMGGYQAGDVASQLAVDEIRAYLQREDESDEETKALEGDGDPSLGESIVEGAIQSADRAVSSESEREAARMGTTVVVVVQRGDEVIIAHVGDSRVYRLRSGELEQMTADHSFAAEVESAGLGKELSDVLEPYRHFITRALGALQGSNAIPDVQRAELEEGDRFLLCSDGVHDTLDHETLERILDEGDREEAASTIVDTAFEFGSTDNMTAAVIDVVDGGAD